MNLDKSKLIKFLAESSTKKLLNEFIPTHGENNDRVALKLFENYDTYNPSFSMLEKNVSDKLKQTILDLSKINDLKFVFGGSIAAAGLNLLDREIKDIDLFINSDVTFAQLTKILTKDENSDLENYGSETTTDINGKEIKRFSFKTKDDEVNVCVFMVDELSYSQTMFFGLPIRLMSINDVINAKNCYSKKECKSQQKHKKDLKAIYSNLYKLAS